MSGSRKAPRPFPWMLFRHWAVRMLLLWSLLSAVIFLVQTVLATFLHDEEDLVRFMNMLDGLPDAFKAMIGGDALMPSNISGIVAIGYQHPTILTMLMTNAVWVPVALLTSPMELGTLELLLARPITRTRVYWMAAALGILSQIGLVGVVFLGTVVSARYIEFAGEIDLRQFARISVNLAAMAVAVMGLAYLAATWLSETRRVVGVVVGYIVGSYLLQFAALYLPRLDSVHPLTIFYYHNPNAVLRAEAMPWGNIGILILIAAVAFTLGWLRWRSRDMQTA